MLTPYATYKQEYENMEQNYEAIQDKADKFKYLSENLPEDSKARQIYEGYANDLNSMADDVLKRGLNMSNRRGLMSLKRRYAGEIGRLEQADTLKKAQIEEQRKALLQNPTLLFSRNAQVSSIDDYLDNPDMSYTPYSGALLTQRTAQAASALAKSLREYGQGKALDNYTSTWLQQHGFTAGEVMQAINNPDDPNSSKVLNSIVENAVQSTPIPQWGDKGTLDQAYRYAREGLWQAVGQTQVSPMENYEARLQAQMRKESQDNNLNGYNSNFNPLPLRSQQEVSNVNKEIEKYKKYFYTDAHGRTLLTPEGLREYRNTKKRPSGTALYQAQYGKTDSKAVYYMESDFKRFLDRIGGGKYIGKGQNDWQPGNIGNVWNRYISSHKADSYDTYHSTEYYKPVTGDEAANWTAQIMGASTDSDGTIILQPVDFAAQKGWVNTNNAIKGEDVNNFKVVGISGSYWGGTAKMVNEKTGKSIRVPLNMGNINTTAKENSQNFYNEADIWGAVASSSVKPKTKTIYDDYGNPHVQIVYDEKGNIVWTKEKMTDANKIYAKQRQSEAAQMGTNSLFTGVTPSKNTTITLKPMW